MTFSTFVACCLIFIPICIITVQIFDLFLDDPELDPDLWEGWDDDEI